MTEQAQIYPFEKEFKPVTRDPDNAKDFLNEINIYNDRYSEGEWIFRGQNNAAWTLIPSVFRLQHLSGIPDPMLGISMLKAVYFPGILKTG